MARVAAGVKDDKTSLAEKVLEIIENRGPLSRSKIAKALGQKNRTQDFIRKEECQCVVRSLFDAFAPKASKGSLAFYL